MMQKFALFNLLIGLMAAVSIASTKTSPVWLFERKMEILSDHCGKTYNVEYPTQGRCNVALWAVDPNEVSFVRSALIGLWKYQDDDLEVIVTFNREPYGYSIKVNTNDVKYKDRLDFKVSRKYIQRAIEVMKVSEAKTLVARFDNQAKEGNGYSEVSRGQISVYQRTVNFAGSSNLYDACVAKWTGFQCVISLIRNRRGETLLNQLADAALESGGLRLKLKSHPGWQRGSAFSSVLVAVSADRYVADFKTKKDEFGVLVRNVRPLQFLVTQADGDDLKNAVYIQSFKSQLRGVRWSPSVTKSGCEQNYMFIENKFKGICDVPLSLPGLLAQSPTLVSRFINVDRRSSFVEMTITEAGYRIKFSGDEDNVGTFARAEPFFNEALKTIGGHAGSRIFFVY